MGSAALVGVAVEACAASRPRLAWLSLLGKGGFDDRYELGEPLGQGSFGRVFAARPRARRRGRAPESCAVKALDVRNPNSPERLSLQLKRQAVREAELWRCIGRSEYCVRLLQVFVAPRGWHFLVMERCAMSLADALALRPTMLEGAADLARLFRQMLLGLQHVHGAGVAHRDVKPDNILFGGEGGATAKLGDFGMATRLPAQRLLRAVCGTAPYMSPEMVQKLGYDGGTDVWSLGATAYFVLYREWAYAAQEPAAETIKRAIARGSPAPRYQRASDEGAAPPEAEDLVRRLLIRDRESRCSAARALRCAFVQPAESCTMPERAAWWRRPERAAPQTQPPPSVWAAAVAWAPGAAWPAAILPPLERRPARVAPGPAKGPDAPSLAAAKRRPSDGRPEGEAHPPLPRLSQRASRAVAPA